MGLLTQKRLHFGAIHLHVKKSAASKKVKNRPKTSKIEVKSAKKRAFKNFNFFRKSLDKPSRSIPSQLKKRPLKAKGRMQLYSLKGQFSRHLTRNAI